MAALAARKGVESLRKLAEHDYDFSLNELLLDDDYVRREKRLWRLAGVALKEGFSSPVARRPTPYMRAAHRWDIDPKRLATKIANDSWEIEIARGFLNRRKDEALDDFMLRLKSETNFGKALKQKICQLVCSDNKLRQELTTRMNKAGLKPYARWLNPDTVISVLAVGIVKKLGLPVEASMIAVAVIFAMATTGLAAMCEVAGYGSKMVASAKKEKTAVATVGKKAAKRN